MPGFEPRVIQLVAYSLHRLCYPVDFRRLLLSAYCRCPSSRKVRSKFSINCGPEQPKARDQPATSAKIMGTVIRLLNTDETCRSDQQSLLKTQLLDWSGHSISCRFTLVLSNGQPQNKPLWAIIFRGTSCTGSYHDLFLPPPPPTSGHQQCNSFPVTAAAPHVSRRATLVLTVNIHEELLHSFLLNEVRSHVISTWTTSATAWKVGGTYTLSTHFENCV